MPFTGPIEDRLALRELYSRYADAAFTGNGQAWLDCWTEDCVWMTPMGELKGKQALLAQWEMLWAGIEQMTFFTEVGSIEAQGDSARSHAYCRESSLWKDGRRITVTGRYEDEVVRDSGVWRFMRRTFTLLLQES